MRRSLYGKLQEWKSKEDRKPLILNGARQVGKTYLLQEFGRKEYKKLAFFSLDREQTVASVFETGATAKDILLSLSAISNVDITPGDTLIVLDEVQDCPKALEALKYLCEDAPDYHVVVAGSLLGLSLHSGVSYPVGKVEELKLYPMTFPEFLEAIDKQRMAETLLSGSWTVINMLGDEYIRLLRQYYYVGGMPAAVKAFAEQRGLQTVREIQRNIIQDYRRDFSKHAPAREVPRINMMWDCIPAQLAKENKKFMYGAVRKSARAADFELAIQWLMDAGLVYKVTRANSPQVPLKLYEDLNAFKLFLLDVGLMGAMADTSAETMLVDNKVFTEYKGAFSELYALTQIKALEMPVYYHSVESSTIELDFLVQMNDKAWPIEVKAETNVKAMSMRTFIDKHPDMNGVRLSMLPYKEQDRIVNIPLYACMEMGRAL